MRFNCSAFLVLLGMSSITVSLYAADDALRRCGAISNDIQRLQCFDELVPQDDPQVPKDPAREAVDKFLAQNLIDPASAVEYSVSDVLPCKSLSKFWPKDAQAQAAKCVCYDVNSKNRMGGYTGVQLSYVAVMKISDDVWLALKGNPISEADGAKACYSANMQPRPTSMIKSNMSR
jgi:hypothetical protein